MTIALIISHKHRYIFFAVPKTGTHAVREALRLSMGQQDWEQQMLFGKQTLPIPELAKVGHGHLSVQQVRAFMEPEHWQNYLKFAFVRNPFDRFVSACAFLNRENPQFHANPQVWMKAALQRQAFRDRVLIRPQAWQLNDADGQSGLDRIGRYEELQNSLNEILVTLGIATVDLKRRNRSSHTEYKNYYDQELTQMVADFYAQDLQSFAYSSI